MDNQIQIFNNPDFGKVRTTTIDQEPWFVLKDVCQILGLGSTHKVFERLDEDERNQIPVIDSIGRKQETAVINESGLYNVILRSDKPNTKPFRKWVTSEVLPSIRKHGAYATPATLEAMISDPDTTIYPPAPIWSLGGLFCLWVCDTPLYQEDKGGC